MAALPGEPGTGLPAPASGSVPMRNYELFNTPEFKLWAERDTQLSWAEQYLFEKFGPLLQADSRVLDIGTGNGRFLLALAQQGLHDLHGIDLAEKLLRVARARARREGRAIGFCRMDACRLGFPDQTFDLVLALQQIFSLLDTEPDRKNALQETYRVLKPKGLLVCSFLHYPGREFNKLLSLLVAPIKMLKSEYNYLNRQYLPYLRIGHKVNFNYLIYRQPYLYWWTTAEILRILNEVGFEIVEIKTHKMILDHKDEFENGGMIHVICKKP
jgi:ubiquinone/menaquinone biosynthesis C-methylase UbiE